MPMKKCIFSDSLKQQSPLIKQSSVGDDSKKVECVLCHAVFNISHGQKADIIANVSTKNVVSVKSSSQSETSCFCPPQSTI
jgi:hypothetical protein